jgi:hypothetical protein
LAPLLFLTVSKGQKTRASSVKEVRQGTGHNEISEILQ